MTKRWFLALGAIVLLVGGALAAVLVSSRGSSPSVAVDTIQLAAANTQAADSMQFELHADGKLDVSASGVVSGDGQHGQVSVKVGPMGQIDERVVDGTVYVQAGGLLGGSDGDWYSISADRLHDLGKSLGGDAGAAFDGTPTSALDALNQLAGPVETVGDDTVAGRHAMHYRVSVDAKGADDPVDVWIDDADRVVKVTTTVPNGGDVTFEVTAFGVPVDVQAPPADQVQELPDLSGLIGNGALGTHI